MSTFTYRVQRWLSSPNRVDKLQVLIVKSLAMLASSTGRKQLVRSLKHGLPLEFDVGKL